MNAQSLVWALCLGPVVFARPWSESNAFSQDRLDSIRTSVRVAEPSTAASSTTQRSHDSSDRGRNASMNLGDRNSSWNNDDDSYSIDDCFALGVGAFWVVASPVWLPRLMIGDVGEQGYFPAFPYVYDLPGYMMIEPEVPLEPYPWSMRIRGEYADGFQDISLIGGQLLVETTTRIGADVATDYRREKLANGRHDSLWTGDVNALYRFAQSEHWQFRAGVGMNWLADSVGSDFGYNLTYGMDWFPCRPWIVSSEMDWGEIGHAHLIHLRGTLGIQVHMVEAFSGYDYYDLGAEHLQGLVAGLRFWF